MKKYIQPAIENIELDVEQSILVNSDSKFNVFFDNCLEDEEEWD